MIPDFDEHGYLPAGIHRATLEEIAERFGWQSQNRREQMESVYWLVEIAKRAGATRIVLNGSFVTNVPEPKDVDGVLLTRPGFPLDPVAEAELRAGLPFLDLDLVEEEGFEEYIEVIFGTDRHNVSKGVIEVSL